MTNSNGAQNILVRVGPIVGFVGIAFVLGVAGLSRVGCVNLHTPPGHEGYVRSNPIAGAGKFVGVQLGPTSTGWVWRQKVVNIDIRPRTYSEEMKILTKDRLELTFRAHARIRLRPTDRKIPHYGVKEVVEKYGGRNWYENNVRERFTAAVRDQVQARPTFEVKSMIVEIATAVKQAMNSYYQETPIEFLSVDIGNIEYPEVVVRSVVRKFVTKEDNERKDIELKIAQKRIEIGKAEAHGVRDAQSIIRTTLDPMYLQYEALGAIEELGGSTNTTFLVMPFSKTGGSPIIMSLDK